MIVLKSGGIRGPSGTCRTTEFLCCEQGLLELRAVKQSELGFSNSKPVVSFEWVCHLGEFWRVCCQEVEVGGLWRLLMLFRTSCLTLIDCCLTLSGANSCSRLTGGISGEGGGTGGRNVSRRQVEDSGTSPYMPLPERVCTIYHKVIHTIRKG
jgi:hypothetical protein